MDFAAILLPSNFQWGKEAKYVQEYNRRPKPAQSPFYGLDIEQIFWVEF